MPVLTLPIPGHVEQQVNAGQVEEAGFALRTDCITPAVLEEFFEKAPQIEAQLQEKYIPEGNEWFVDAFRWVVSQVEGGI